MNMLKSGKISKSWSCLPYIMAQRFRVRYLPKEKYDENETPYMKLPRPKRAGLTDFYALVHRKNWKFAEVKNWYKWKQVESMREDQMYLPKRHKVLGPNLATTHFIAYRGGKVKFVGKDKWMTKENIENGEIPSIYSPDYIIEELDLSGTNICYEGFENLSQLHGMKKLFLRNCSFVDDWCLQRSYLFEKSLEYLDISGCHNITERGICTLYVLSQLRTLVINDTPNIQHKELVSLLLQDILPKCEVVGVDFSDPTFIKRLENYMT